jgi:hypothetical protein
VKKVIDTDWLTAHRDELWAEAREAYVTGEVWWVQSETSLDESKERFKLQTPIHEKLGAFLAGPLRTALSGKSATEIFEAVFCDPQRPLLPTPGQIQEIGRIMKHTVGVKPFRLDNRRCYEVRALIDGRPETDAEEVAREEARKSAGFFGST